MCQARPLSLRSIALSHFYVLLLMASIMCAAVAVNGEALAQSGRRAPKPTVPSPPSPTTTGTEVQGESESIPRGSTLKSNSPQLPVLLLELDNPLFDVSFMASDYVLNGLVNRLRESPDLTISPGGKVGRKEARERAKNQTDTFVVVTELEEDAFGGRQSIGRVDPTTLIVRYYIYAPRTGTLKTQGRVEQRPVRASTRIGGVRIPLPTPRGGRSMVEYMLEQLGRDAADRVMTSLNIRLPPEQ